MEQSIELSNIINITFSADMNEAYVQLGQVSEEFTSSVKELETHLNNNGITYGLNYEMLTDISINPTKHINKKVTVARGRKPIKGADGYIQYNYNNQEETSDSKLLEHKTVDLREVTQINNVIKGEMLAEKVLPTEGTNGVNVKGEPVVPPDGKIARFKIGKNVVMNQEQNKLYAAIDGMVSITDRNKLNVFPIYEINGDVDYRIGNIDFNGTLIVRGSVLTGFTLKASGDIRVIGTIDGANVTAGGSIDVTEGIVGHNKGMVDAGKNIKCSFILDAFVNAGETIVVSQSIMHSTVKAGNSVICQGGNGLIVGGQIQAGDKVVARTVGNATSTATIIEVGIKPELRKENMELHIKLKDFQENVDKTDKALVMLTQLEAAGQLSDDKKAMLLKLQMTKQHSDAEFNDIKDRLKEIETELQNTDQATVEIQDIVYSGTKLVIGKYVKFIRDGLKRVKFEIHEGDIRMVSED